MVKPQREKPRAGPRAPARVPVKPTAQDWLLLLKIATLFAAVLWIYWPVLDGDWLWDDDYLISQNALVHDPGGFWNIWFKPAYLIDYFPLTVSVEWLEWQLWPDSTFCYHFTSLLMHICGALLVWRLLAKLGLRLAWLGALLFAVHPVMVESVAWMAELKNTLSLPPFLLAMTAWIDFEREGRRRDYFLALGLFLVAMLCKTSMVMFPVVILLFAWWKRDRIGWSDLATSAAFFAISVAVGLTMISFLRYGVGQEFIPLGGFFSRLVCAGLSLVFYFSKCVLPLELSPIYPQWPVNPPSLAQFLPWPVLGIAIYWLWLRRQGWGRHVLLGFGFFLLNLLPFVGFHTISFMRFSWVMDHFLYLPIIGLIGLAVAGLEQVHHRLTPTTRPYGIGLVTVVLVVLAFDSREYSKIYLSQGTLWTYTINLNPDAWPAHNNLGNFLSDAGRMPEAREEYEEALRLNPDYPEAHNNLGLVFAQMGQVPEAIDQFKEALRLCPTLVVAQENLAKMEALPNSAPKKNPPGGR